MASAWRRRALKRRKRSTPLQQLKGKSWEPRTGEKSPDAQWRISNFMIIVFFLRVSLLFGGKGSSFSLLFSFFARVPIPEVEQKRMPLFLIFPPWPLGSLGTVWATRLLSL